jgi:Tol biopolymer transport system component
VPPTAVPPTAVPPTTGPTQPTGQPGGSEILYLKGGALVALNPATRQERTIAPEVRDFTATRDGRTLAMVRGVGNTAEIWLANRDGSGLRQLTSNSQPEGGLALANDGSALAFVVLGSAAEKPRTWQDWTTWCSRGEVRLVTIADGASISLGKGCDPAFSPDGRRVAFVTPAGATETDVPAGGINNAVRLVNRQGQNGWNFATANLGENNGRLVYAPAFSPDGKQLAYQRFVGYQALVDIGFTEMGGSLEGKGQLLGSGAGWMLPPMFAPDSGRVAVVEHNFSDARGTSGYELWSVQVLQLGQPGEVILPEGSRPTIATRIDRLTRVTGAAWAPEGNALAITLPDGWNANTAPGDLVYTEEKPGELWRWRPGSVPTEQLASGVDFASPILWLPVLP